MPDLRLAVHQIDTDNIEAAGLIGQLVDVIISFGNALELALLADIDKIFRFAPVVIAARFHFYEDKLLAIHRYDVDLADLSVMKITFDDLISER